MRRFAGRLSLLLGLLLLLLPRTSAALFHFAVIDEFMTSHNGDPNIQFVEIRMLLGSQNFVMDSVLGAFDPNGTYLGDVLIVPTDVLNSGGGVRWVMGTAQFQSLSGITPDFLIPPGLPTGGGMVCWGAPPLVASVPPPGFWDHSDPELYIDCIAYGSYDGPFVTKAGPPTPLDADGHSLIRIGNADVFECAPQASPENNAGETASIGANPLCPVCGNDVIEPGEECDDGDTVPGDGCSATCQVELVVQTKDQQKCINALNKNLAKVAKTKGKIVCDCIKNGAKGKLENQTIEDCLLEDPKNKLGKATAKTLSDAGKKCVEPLPDLGPTDPNTVNAAAIQKELDLVDDVFGFNLTSVIALEINDKQTSKCQQLVMKFAKKCQDKKLKEFNSCKKKGLKAETILIPSQLEDACLGTGPSGIPDTKGKIAGACNPTTGKIRSIINKKCVDPVNLSAAFPGCGTADPAELAACLDQKVECRVCLALNQADNLLRDCDEFDDGTINGSCP